jgi:hypothetical protein
MTSAAAGSGAIAGGATERPMERLVHLHIPKTAGNSLKTAMANCTTRTVRVFPHWQEENYHSFALEDYDFYSGHIGYETASKLGGSIVSVFRHPVDRFISVYYFWRYLHDAGIEVRQATIIANKYSLDQFARIKDVYALTEELCNRMTYQTAFGASARHRELLRTQGRTDEDIFQMARRNVDTFSVIGVQENMQDFETKIERRYGVDITLGSINQNEQRIPIQDISFGTKSRILEWVYMDMELYDHVLQLCRERAEPVPQEQAPTPAPVAAPIAAPVRKAPQRAAGKPAKAAPPPDAKPTRAGQRNGSARH